MDGRARRSSRSWRSPGSCSARSWWRPSRVSAAARGPSPWPRIRRAAASRRPPRRTPPRTPRRRPRPPSRHRTRRPSPRTRRWPPGTCASRSSGSPVARTPDTTGPSRFAPAVTFDLGGGWSTESHTTDRVVLARGEGRLTLLGDVDRIYPKGKEQAAAGSLRKLIGRIAGTTGTGASKVRGLTIDERPGFSVDLTADGDQIVPILGYGEETIYLQPGATTRYVLIDAGDRIARPRHRTGRRCVTPGHPGHGRRRRRDRSASADPELATTTPAGRVPFWGHAAHRPPAADQALPRRCGRPRRADRWTSNPGSSAWSARTGRARAPSSRSCWACSRRPRAGDGPRTRCRHARARRSASSSATCPSTTACRPTCRATDFVRHMARMSGLPGGAARERTAEVLRHVGLYEERYRRDRRLFDRHEAAGEAGPGPRPRPAAAAAGRTDQRARPGRPRRDARPRHADRHRIRHRDRSSPATCSARSSGSATTSSPSTPAGCCGPHRSPSFTDARASSPSRSRRARPAGERAGRPRPRGRHVDGRIVLVPLDDERPYDIVRDEIVDLGLAAGAARAAAPAPRRPVPRRGRRHEPADRRRRTAAATSTTSATALRRPAPRPPLGPRGALPTCAPLVLRDRSRRTGEDRADRLGVLAILPAVLAVGSRPSPRRRRAAASLEDASPSGSRRTTA